MHQTRHSGVSVDRVRRSRSVRKMQKKNEVCGELSAVSQETTRAVAWRPTTIPLSPRPLRSKLETLAQSRSIVDKATASPATRKRMTGKCLFCGYDFLAKAAKHLGFRDNVLDTKLGPKYDVTKPFVLRIRRKNLFNCARMPWIWWKRGQQKCALYC